MSYSRLALCDDDRCPWKHAAPLDDPAAADRAAEQHQAETGHTSTFYPGQVYGRSRSFTGSAPGGPLPPLPADAYGPDATPLAEGQQEAPSDA